MSAGQFEAPWDLLVFDVRRSIRYHLSRSRFFDRWNKWTNGINIMSATAAVATFLSSHPVIASVAASVVAVVSVADLVVGTNTMARQHSDLAKRFNKLECEMIKVVAPDEEIYRNFTSKRLEIEGDEPPVMRVLDIVCHNELARAMDRNNDIYEIPWMKRRLAQWISFDAQGIKRAPPESAAPRSLPGPGPN